MPNVGELACSRGNVVCVAQRERCTSVIDPGIKLRGNLLCCQVRVSASQVRCGALGLVQIRRAVGDGPA